MERLLYETDFLSLREREGYVYAHMTRTQGQLVVILPYRVVQGVTEYLARVEICPAHKLTADTYSITGGVSAHESPVEAAQRELMEEAGYHVIETRLESLGCVRPSKQSDTAAHLYAVDVTHDVQQAIKGDGSRWETGASVRWVSYEDGLELVDPLFITAMARLRGQSHGN